MVVTALAMILVLLPGVPLIGLLVLTQTLNAVLVVPLLVVMVLMSRDKHLLGRFTVRWPTLVAEQVTLVGVALSVVLLLR